MVVIRQVHDETLGFVFDDAMVNSYGFQDGLLNFHFLQSEELDLMMFFKSVLLDGSLNCCFIIDFRIKVREMDPYCAI